MFGFKKKKSIEDEMEDELEVDVVDEKNEVDCCGIQHKRLDDLIAKVGFLVHVVILLSEFYRGRGWWLNLGSVVCYVLLIYGIALRKWFLYIPYFCINPFLVIVQVIHLLRTSYNGRDHNESLWSGFVNFITLTLVVLFITTIHVVSILVVLVKFQPFSDYVEQKTAKLEDDDDEEFRSGINPNRLQSNSPANSPSAQSTVEKSEAPRKVSWAERTRTFFYPRESLESSEDVDLKPLKLDQQYHPASPKIIRTSVV
ncbi:hypothetical protein M3Y94_00875800 [Aphelenchoides besseyi]|nr:hypothetical protein M3Y94_00875800 [Aphelenchoides besseyi]KAI6226609.1 hypothetical protein M3Y95_00638800 [Aphelenchoides besseyi]